MFLLSDSITMNTKNNLKVMELLCLICIDLDLTINRIIPSESMMKELNAEIRERHVLLNDTSIVPQMLF